MEGGKISFGWPNDFFFQVILEEVTFERRSGCQGASQVALVVKNLPASAGDIRDVGSIHQLGRSSGGGHGNPL